MLAKGPKCPRSQSPCALVFMNSVANLILFFIKVLIFSKELILFKSGSSVVFRH